MIKRYVSYFVSYLMFNLKKFDNINKVILFGSVARGEASENSDVDIFIEVKKKTKSFEDDVKKITENFYQSREGLIFKAKGISNKINIIIGKLEDFESLKNSIESTGIILYGNYISNEKVIGKKYIIFSWDKIKKNRGAFLNKLYGFKVGNKKYTGLVEKFRGEKIGKSSIMVPIENREEFVKLFKHYGVRVEGIEIWR